MGDLFISYAREDEAFVRRLHDALTARGKEPWVDWAGIRPSDLWMQSVHEAIDAADAVLFVMTADSLRSQECGHEIDHATSRHKRLIPVVAVDLPEDATIPSSLREVNWIPLRPQDDFEAGLEALVQAVDTDLDLVRLHTRVLTRATAWDLAGRRAISLLRGDELRQAEDWVARAAGGARPEPSELQAVFIAASRRAAVRRQRTAVVGSLGVAGLALALAAFALVQRGYAIHQAHLALSRVLSIEANDRADTEPDVALLLGVEAARASQTIEARSTLVRAIQAGANPVLGGGSASVGVVQFTPDGRTLLAISEDGSTSRWNVATRRELPPPIPRLKGSAVGYSRDGSILAVVDPEGHGELWDVRTGTRIYAPFGDSVVNVVLSPRGDAMVVADSFGNVSLWSASPPERLGPLGRTFSVWSPNSFEFSPDGLELASIDRDSSKVVLWDVASRTRIGHPMGTVSSAALGPTSMAFSPDEPTLAIGNGDGTIELWDLVTSTYTSVIGVGPQVWSVAFSPNGSIVAAGDGSGNVTFTDLATQAGLGAPLGVRTGIVGSVAFSPDGGLLASGKADGTITLWRVATRGQLGVPLGSHPARGFVTSVAFDPTRDLVASGNGNGTVDVWEGRTRRALRALSTDSTHAVQGVAFSPDGRFLAAGTIDGAIYLWKVPSFTAVDPPLAVPREQVTAVAFSPDGKVLAATTNFGSLILWDVASRRMLRPPLERTDGKSLTSVAFSPDGKTVVSGVVDGGVDLWDVRTRTPRGSLRPDRAEGVHAVDFSPDGRMLATGNDDGTVTLWDVAKRRIVGVPLGVHVQAGSDAARAVAFSPDGRTLVSADEGGEVHLWDVASRRSLGAPLKGHDGSVEAVAFSSDGKQLASGGSDGWVVLWDDILWSSDWARLIARACSYAGRNLTRSEWTALVPGEPYERTCANLLRAR